MEKVETIYCFIAENPEGEGIVGVQHDSGSIWPLFCSNTRTLGIMRPQAVEAAKVTGRKIKLMKFVKVEESEVI